MYEHVVYEQEGPVTLITLNRPEKMNCIGPRTHRELVDAWGRFREDDDALVAVLTGAGDDTFCAGGDLEVALGQTDGGTPLIDSSREELAAHERGERDGILGPSRWTDIYKPIIAAVNGVAYAGGLEWACFADIRIADERASFGVTCRRWNIGLADGGTQRLPRIIGMGRAMELIITLRVSAPRVPPPRRRGRAGPSIGRQLPQTRPRASAAQAGPAARRCRGPWAACSRRARAARSSG